MNAPDVTVAVLRIDDVDRIAPLWHHGVIATIRGSSIKWRFKGWNIPTTYGYLNIGLSALDQEEIDNIPKIFKLTSI